MFNNTNFNNNALYLSYSSYLALSLYSLSSAKGLISYGKNEVKCVKNKS